jgi:hypothetical protein
MYLEGEPGFENQVKNLSDKKASLLMEKYPSWLIVRRKLPNKSRLKMKISAGCSHCLKSS